MGDQYEVVISGISGLFPESDDLDELEQNLLNKINLVSSDDRRWVPGELNVPSGIGKVKTSNTFDMTFFGIHRKLCEIMDPHTRLCLEHAYAAVCDAGVNPTEMGGSNAAVIMSSVTSETEYECVMGAKNVGHAMLGHSRTMQANRLSYFMNLKGPSLALDCSWSGGMQALQIAYNMITKGQATSAIVGVCSLISKPEVSIHYQAMGKLNKDEQTKCFSANADGYNRSEACVVFFMQKANHAKRSYGSILGVLSNNYGSRDLPYTEFSSKHYKQLLEELYKKANVKPNDIAYIEADGCASKTIDALELNAINEVLCKNRQSPLSIGCVKSNLGHTEASSSFVGIAKVLIALKSGIIPPNINYDVPNPDVPALASGQLQVVTEPTPLKGNIVAVSCIGVAGTYGHVIIKQNPKAKTSLLKLGELPPDGLPRLIIISGREEKALNTVINKLESMPIDEEFVALTHSIFKTEIKRHLFRGYTLLGDRSRVNHQVKAFDGGVKRPVWYVFSGMGSQWCGMGIQLMRLPTFAKAIHKCQEVLKPEGVDVIKIITSQDLSMFENILHSFVGIAAVQIGLVDVLRELGIEPDGIVGHSVGELGCAYADGCFTSEQMILSAYARGRASIETKLIEGKMAAVGMGYNQIKEDLPSTIEVACHNAAESCTLSGPSKDMEEYINELKSRGVFAKLVNVSNIAYHSKHIKPAAPALLKYLKQVIPNPKPRSKRWISSSIPETSWDSDLAKSSSAEYHTNNLLSSVLFEEASAHIPKNAVVIEIAPHGLLQAILKRSLTTCSNISLTNRLEADGISFLFNSIGKLYLEGIEMDIAKLYPTVEFPVSRETRHLSPIVTWDHSEQWIIWSFINRSDLQTLPCWKTMNIGLSDERFENFAHNKINNRIIMPSSSYLDLVIEMFNELKKDSSAPIMIENVKFNKNVEIPVKAQVELYLLLQRGSGDFEICLGDNAAASGRINVIDDISHLKHEVNEEGDESYISMSPYEFYNYLKHMGIDQGDVFRPLQKIQFNDQGLIATIEWTGQWVPFIDSLLKLVAFYDMNSANKLKLVNELKHICIDFESFPNDQCKDVKVIYSDVTKVLYCQGLQILYPETTSPCIAPPETKLALEQFKFVPYTNPPVEDVHEILNISVQTIYENLNKFKDGGISQLNVIDIKGDGYFSTYIPSISKHDEAVEVVIKQCDSDKTITNLDLNDINKESIWLISGSESYKKSIKVLKTAKQAFLLTKCNAEILAQAELNNLVHIFEFNNNNENIILYKYDKSVNDVKNVVNLSNNNWKQDLQSKINKEASKDNNSTTIYLFGVVKFLSEIYDIVKDCDEFDNSDLLRFYFVDEAAPQFSLSDDFYSKQMEKELKVNICLNNIWGTMVLLPLKDKPKHIDQVEQPNLFDMSSIKSDNVRLTALGLNLPDITGFTGLSRLGVLEYSGFDKNGDQIFGLSHLDEGNNLVIDKQLTWKKPSTWSASEAVSIPLYYAMAFYILEVEIYPKPGMSVFVHRGILPISQAIINVALSKGYTVFTTYQSKEEQQQIKKLFPKLKSENIFSCETGNFHLELALIEKNKASIVVNTLTSENMVHPTQKCTRINGHYFQISIPAMLNKTLMGMSFFLQEAVVHGFPPSAILEIPEYKKEMLNKCLEKGIQDGIIKPIKTMTLSNDSLNSIAINTLKTIDDLSLKLITSFEKNSVNKNCEIFLCDPRKNYLILGGQQGIWLEMIEWLIQRGAKNISVILKKHILTGYIAQRLNSILNNHPSVRVSFISSKRISSTTNIENMYNEINGALELAAIFIIGTGLKDKITAIDQVLREKKSLCKVICIGEGGETVCERRRHNQMPALSINCTANLEPQFIIPNLDWLTSNLNKAPVVVLKECNSLTSSVIDTRNLSFKNHIPENINELIEFQSVKAEQAYFREIKTACPEFRYNKELPPVFIFSSLKPNQIDKLASRLFYPAFEGILPMMFPSIEYVAEALYEDTKRFSSNVFTLIADDWGGALALSVAKLLEANNKYVSLILLDAAPATVLTWAKTAIDPNGQKLILRYLSVNAKVKKTLNLITDWDKLLEVVLENSNTDNDLKEKIRDGINMLRCRLNCLAKYTGTDVQVNAKCHLLRPDGSSESDQCELEMHCKRSVKIHLLDEISHIDNVNSEKAARIINGLVLFEYKDAANKIDDERIGINLLSDAKYRSDGLVRA